MLAMVRKRGLGIYGLADRRFRFEVPLAMWNEAKAWSEGEYGWEMPGDPPNGESWPYLVLGYPFVVDPSLPADGLRLVERRTE
jgi:hypothetical protein